MSVDFIAKEFYENTYWNNGLYKVTRKCIMHLNFKAWKTKRGRPSQFELMQIGTQCFTSSCDTRFYFT